MDPRDVVFAALVALVLGSAARLRTPIGQWWWAAAGTGTSALLAGIFGSTFGAGDTHGFEWHERVLQLAFALACLGEQGWLSRRSFPPRTPPPGDHSLVH
ncbi:hypothetical protein [Dactylosporangium sp. CS-033363]|uniref:hypothetical protein n=1 Tax=Dactylosporangium sp. CS-033363 TaxID=3239935 RepID=UPI003D8A1B2D